MGYVDITQYMDRKTLHREIEKFIRNNSIKTRNRSKKGLTTAKKIGVAPRLKN